MGLTRIRAQQITDIDYKQAVRAATDENITLAGGAPVVVDGVTLQANNRVLVCAQTRSEENGLYYVDRVGTGSNGTWLRTSDADQTGEMNSGMMVMVTEGIAYADTSWKLLADSNIIIGTTKLTFECIKDTVNDQQAIIESLISRVAALETWKLATEAATTVQQLDNQPD
jgi:phage-related tail fiber protein